MVCAVHHLESNCHLHEIAALRNTGPGKLTDYGSNLISDGVDHLLPKIGADVGDVHSARHHERYCLLDSR